MLTAAASMSVVRYGRRRERPLSRARERDRVRECLLLVQRFGDRRQHALHVLVRVGVGDAQDTPSRLTQVGVARGVLAAFIMLAAIQFDDEPGLATCEVDDVEPKRDLAPELAAEQLPVSHLRPEPPLEIGLPRPEAARSPGAE